MKPFDLKKFLAEQAMDLQTTANQNTPDAWARLRSEHVNYFPPSAGPFKCGHCKFARFKDDPTKGVCVHPEVKANIEAEGCCNEYKPSEK